MIFLAEVSLTTVRYSGRFVVSMAGRRSTMLLAVYGGDKLEVAIR